VISARIASAEYSSAHEPAAKNMQAVSGLSWLDVETQAVYHGKKGCLS